MAVPGGMIAQGQGQGQGHGRSRGWISGRRSPRALRPRDPRATLTRILPPLLFALLVLVIWQLYVGIAGIPQSSLPKPTQIAAAVWRDRSLLLSNGWTTLTEIVLGYLAAVLLGVLLAAVVSTSRIAERAVYPWLVISQTVPIPAIAPIFVVWTGFDIRPKLMVIALVSFFPIVVNMIDGLKSTDPELLNLLRTLGAGRWRRFRVAQLPASLPFLFSGLKVAAVFSVIGAVFGEWVGSSSGLGYLILTYNQQTATADMFATVVALSLLGVGLFSLVSVLERLLLPWYHDPRRRESEPAAG
jgi:ABC-type nitrate/sulfonate/bicarbonate transport system permease component